LKSSIKYYFLLCFSNYILNAEDALENNQPSVKKISVVSNENSFKNNYSNPLKNLKNLRNRNRDKLRRLKRKLNNVGISMKMFQQMSRQDKQIIKHNVFKLGKMFINRKRTLNSYTADQIKEICNELKNKIIDKIMKYKEDYMKLDNYMQKKISQLVNFAKEWELRKAEKANENLEFEVLNEERELEIDEKLGNFNADKIS